MKILIYYNSYLPVFSSNRTDKIIQSLISGLLEKNIEVILCSYGPGSFKNVNHIDLKTVDVEFFKNLKDVDLIHFHSVPNFVPNMPYLNTCYDISTFESSRLVNTVFLSKEQANYFGSNNYIPTGINLKKYQINSEPENYFVYFYTNFSECEKVINLIKNASEYLLVVGAKVWWNKYDRLSYIEYADDELKVDILSKARAIINLSPSQGLFPTNIIEALSLGAPTIFFKDDYLQSLLNKYGFSFYNYKEFITVLNSVSLFDREEASKYALYNFNSEAMVGTYINLYKKVIKDGII